MTDEQREAERQRRRRYNLERRERHSPHYQSALLRADGTCSPVDAHFIGRLSERCPHEGCGALRFPGETLKSLCCHGGKAVLPPLTSLCQPSCTACTSVVLPCRLSCWRPSPPLNAVCSMTPPSAATSASTYGRYNSALGLASLTFSQEEVSGRGPPVIRVHGQMHRRLPACPAPDVQLRPVADDPTIIAQWVSRGDSHCYPRPQEQYAQLYVHSPADAAQPLSNVRIVLHG